MKLAYWMYAGPAHIGTLRIASSFKNVHAIMHAPLGDDYFNVMRSMLERERDFTPVTASIVDRHVLAQGSQEKVVDNIVRKDREESPDLIVLTPTCNSSILQEDLQNFVQRASLDAQCDVLLADVNHYRVNELQAADRTLQRPQRWQPTPETVLFGQRLRALRQELDNGEPEDKNNYAKVTIICKDSRATSKLLLRDIRAKTWAELLEEWKRINGLEIDLKILKCNVDSREVVWSEEITKESTLFCVYEK